MKIIYLHQYFKTPKMSGGTRSYEIAKRLVANGHEVHILTSWTEETSHDDWFDECIDGIHVHWYPNLYDNRMSFNERVSSFCKFATAATKKAISFKDADVVFATSTPLTIAIPAVIASKARKIPMVFEVRDLWPEVPIAMGILNKPYQIFLAKRLEKWAYNNSKAIIALSTGMKEGIVSTGYPSNKVSVIPNSCDNELFDVDNKRYLDFLARNEWLPKNKVLIYTGTFGIVNDLKKAVDIAIAIQKKGYDITVLLIGDGQKFEEVRNYAKDNDVLDKTLIVKAQVPKNEIPLFLKYAKMASSFAIDIPAIQANSANKFFDALAAAKPVFINYGGWQKDIIEDNHCGVIGWKKTAAEIATELNEFLENKDKYELACQNAKRLALNDFSRDNLAKELQKVLSEACNN